MVEPRSIRRRALAVVLVLVGFYAIAIGVVATLIGLTIAFMHLGLIVIPLATTAIFVSVVVLGATFHTTARLAVPADAIAVTETDHPELFELIDQVAAEMSADRPDVVYLVPDVGAAVAEDTMMVGLISRRRVLHVGVGLLEVVTVDELRAVIAHEFGHYAAADTRLSGIVYRSRESVLRTLEVLEGDTDPGPIEELVGFIFRRYALFVANMTATISREQEILADRWSSRIAGTDPAIRALERVEIATHAYGFLLLGYIYPMARDQILPDDPMAGLRNLMSTWIEATGPVVEFTSEKAPDFYDSHPPTQQRIAAIAEMETQPHEEDPRPARYLLRDPTGAGRSLFDRMFFEGESWRHVGWDEAGTHLARSLGEFGEEVLSLTSTPGGVGRSDLWELLEHGDLRTIRARLGVDADLFQVIPPDEDMADYLVVRLRPYVAAVVIRTIGGDVEWSVDWSGTATVCTPGHDIDQLLDDLFAGGTTAVAARATLVGDP